MAATFTWTILGVKCISSYDGYSDVISEAQWGCFGQELGSNDVWYSAEQSDWASFTYIPGEPYTPRNEVTEEQILQWCWDGGVDKLAVEAEVQAEIDKQTQQIS